MTCGPNRTCYQGCPCHEARWQERLAEADAEVARLSVELTVAGETLLKHNHDWSDRCEAAEAEAAPSQAHLDEMDSPPTLLSRIEAACGLPDPAEACRVVLALCREAHGDAAPPAPSTHALRRVEVKP